MKDTNNEIDSIALNEAQLLLAEKRTSLSVMRTGIAVLALPLSVITFLIATSKFYHVVNVLHFLIPLGILCFSLIVFGIFLIIHAIIRMRHFDRLIHKIKVENNVIGKYIE